MADNPNVEERIVAAKFDASDFEKGVNKTIKKLDELNEKLDFKQTGESVTSFAKKTSEAQEKATSSIEKLTDRYTTFVGMVKQKLLSGLADQVVNVFFRMEKAVLSFAKSMSFDQISAGFAKYESALTSVRMIVNSYKTVKNEITGITEKVHYTQEEAYSAISNLQTYADETSYSMSQMTDAMSKMVSAGVGLDQAEKNVQGIANACAAAGVNAQEASRAFYNLSQAYSSGTLKYTDYRSLQLLNMTNENFEEQLVAAGVKAGTLKETTDKKGNKVYVTKKSDTNKKVTAGKKFTRSQAADALKYNWADTEVMDYLFGNNFYVDVEDFYAAKEASKTTEGREEFLKNLKDYDAVGAWVEKLDSKTNDWKKKYDNVKDNAEERRNLLEDLVEEADWVKEAATKHGQVKDEDIVKWIDKLEDTDQRKIDFKKVKDNQKERRKFLDDLKKTEDVKNNVKGADLGLDATQLTKSIEALDKESAIRQKYDKLNTAEKKEYVKQLITEAESLGKIKNKYDEVAVKAFLAAREARNLQDVINAIGDYVSSKWSKVFDNLIGTLDEASDFFTKLTEGGVASLFTNIADWVAEVSEAFNAGGVGSAEFRDIILLLDEALGNLFDILGLIAPEADDFGMTMQLVFGEISMAMGNFQDWTAKIFNWFNDTERLEKIRGIFGNLSGVFSVFGKVLGIAFNTIGRLFTVFSPVFDAIIVALNKITEPIGELGQNTEAFEKINEAIDNMFKVINPLAEKLGPVIVNIGEILGVIAEFFITGAIDTIIANITLFSDAFGLLLEIFGIGSAQQDKYGKDNGVLGSIKKSIEELAETCKGALATVGDFFKSLFNDIRVLLGITPTDENAITDGGMFANLINFFDTNEFIKNAQGWFEQAKIDIANWFKELPGKIASFFAGLLYTKEVPEKYKAVVDKYGMDEDAVFATPLKEWLDGVVDSVSDFVANIPDYLLQGFGAAIDFFGTIINFIFGTDDQKSTGKTDDQKLVDSTLQGWAKTFMSKITTAVKALPAKIKKLFEDTKGKFKEAWATIKKWFTDSETGKQITAIGTSILTAIKTFIINLPENIKTIIKGIGSIGREIISTIKDAIGIGTMGKEIQDGMEDDFNKISLSSIIATIADIGVTIVNEFLSWFTGTNDIEYNVNWFVGKIVGFITSIPGKLWEEAGKLVNEISGLWSYIVEAIKSDSKDETRSATAEQFKANHPILASFVDGAVAWLKGIPDTLKAAWDETLKKISNFWSGLTGYWNKLDDIDTINNMLKDPNLDTKKRSMLEDNLDELTKSHSHFETENPKIAGFVSVIHGWASNIISGFSSGINDIKAFIDGLPDMLTGAWTTAKSSVTEFFTTFIDFWNDPKVFGSDEAAEDAERTPTEFEEKYPHIAGFIIAFRKWINDIPGSLENAFTNAITGVSSFFTQFSTYWQKLNQVKEIQNALNDPNLDSNRRSILEDMLKEYEDTPTNFEKNYPAVSGMVGSFHGWIFGIADSLSSTWEKVKQDISRFWTDFLEFITNPRLWSGNAANVEDSEKTNFEDDYPMISGWIISFTDWLTNLPTTLQDAFNNAIRSISSITGNFSTYWKQLDRIREIKNKLNDPSLSDQQRNLLQADLSDLESNPTDFEKNYPDISGVVGSFHDWIYNLPTRLNEIWEGVKADLSEFWTRLVTFITDPKTWADFKEGKINIPEDFASAYPALSTFIENVGGWIGSIYGTVSEGWEKLKTDLSQFWTSFTTYIINPETWAEFKEGKVNIPEDFEKAYPTLYNWIKTVGEWVGSIYGTISGGWQQAKDEISKFWNEFIVYISDPDNWTNDENKDRKLTAFEEDYKGIAGFVGGIASWITNLPQTLSNSFDQAKADLGTFFKGFSDYWNKATLIYQRENNKNLTEEERADLERRINEYGNLEFETNHPVVTQLIDSLVGWVSEIPGLVSETITSATTSLNNFWNDLVDAFNGENIPKDKQDKSESIGEKVRNWIVNFFANIPTYITDGITAVLDLINGAFEGITKLINDNINIDSDSVETELAKNAGAALEEISTAAETVVEEASESVGEATEDLDKKASPKDNFVQGLVNIGTTLFNIITKTIPGFIVAGFNWLKNNLFTGETLNSLLDIFTNVTGINPKDFHLENLGNLITEAIKNLPNTVTNLWSTGEDFLRNLLGIKKPLSKEMADAISEQSLVPQEAKDQMKRSWEKAGYDISGAAKDADVWRELQTVADQWGSAIGTIFTEAINNIGPFLINAWNGTLTMFGNIFGMLGDWFTAGVKDESGNINKDTLGKAVKDNFGVEISDPLRDALNSIGENIFKLFTDIIPNFLGSAIGTLIASIPDIVSNFMAGLRAALGNNIKEEIPELMEGVTNDIQEGLESEPVRDVDITDGQRNYLKGFVSKIANGDALFETYRTMYKNNGKRTNYQGTMKNIYDEIMNDNQTYMKYLIASSKNETIDSETLQYIKDNELYTYEELFGSVEELGDKAPDKQAVDSAKFGLNSVGGILETLFKTAFNVDAEGNVTGLSIMSWIGIGAILVSKICDFISTIKDIPHWSTSEATVAKNSINSVMKLAMEALIVGAVFATVASQMNEQQFNQAKDIFDKIVHVIEMVSLVTGGAKILDTVTDIAGIATGASAGVSIIKSTGGIGVASIITSITDMITTITDSLPSFGLNIKEMAQELSSATEPIATVLPYMDSLISLLQKMKEVLTEANNIKYGSFSIEDAKQAITDLLAPLTTFAVITNSPDIHAVEIIDSITELMSMTEEMSEFVTFTEKDDTFNRFKYAMASLGSALSFYAIGSKTNVGKMSDEGIKNAVSFLTAILGNDELMGISQKLTSSEFFSKSTTDMQTSMEQLVIFAGGLAQIGAAAANIDENTGKNINSFIQAMSDVTWNISNGEASDLTNAGTDVTDFSAAMINLGTGISSLVTAAGGINEESFKSIQIILDYLSQLASNVKGFKESKLGEIFVAQGDLSSFGKAVDGLGLSIANFIQRISESELYKLSLLEDTSSAETLKSTIRFGLEILAMMSDSVLNVRYGEPGIVLEGLQTLGEDVVAFINSVGMMSEKFKEVNGTELTSDRMETIRSVVEIFNEMAKGFSNISKLMKFDASTISSVMDALYSVEYKETDEQHIDEFGNMVATYEELPTGVLPRLLEILKKISELVTDNEIGNAKKAAPMIEELFYALSACIEACSISKSLTFSTDPINETVDYFIENFNKIEQLTEKARTLDLEDLDKAKSLFEAIKELGNAIQSYYTSTDIKYDNRFYSALTAFKSLDYDDLSDSISQFIQSYTDILNNPLNSERLTETGFSMAKILAEGMQAAFDSDDDTYHPKVSVVLDDESVKEQMASLFGVENVAEFNISSGLTEAIQQAFGGSETFASLNTMVSTIKEDIAELKGLTTTVGSLQGELTAVQNAFAGMKIFLYKDELVGYITPDITAEQDRLSEIWIDQAAQ